MGPNYPHSNQVSTNLGIALEQVIFEHNLGLKKVGATWVSTAFQTKGKILRLYRDSPAKGL